MKEDLIQYSGNELQDISKHYGRWGFEGKVNAQDAEIDTSASTVDNVWKTPFMF